MRKSCIVQLVIFVVILVVLALSVRRNITGTEAAQPAAGLAAAPAPPTAVAQAAAPESHLGAFKAKLFAQPQQNQEAQPMAAVPLPTMPNTGIEGLTLRLSQPLMLKASRARGLAANERFLYAATYDPTLQSATIYQLHRASGTVAQVRNIQRDGKFVLGGIHAGAMLWAPLASGDKDGPTLILGINPQSLEIERSFEAPDYIAAVAQSADGRVYGVNDGSAFFYEWSADGQLLRQVANASGASYQDMEVVLGSLVCAGLDRDGGVLDVIDPRSLSLLARHRCNTRLSDESFVTHKGFAYADELFYFLPEDGDLPKVLVYALDGQVLDRYVPSVQTTP